MAPACHHGVFTSREALSPNAVVFWDSVASEDDRPIKKETWLSKMCWGVFGVPRGGAVCGAYCPVAKILEPEAVWRSDVSS